MAKLEEIGVTAMVGLVCYLFSILLFGFAVKHRATHIAPRCEARPRDVIYNPNPTDVWQNRGNPWLGWIPWVLKLTYDVMLTGIPGTGTRNGGLEGSMLRCTLDQVINLRFHSFGLRVSTLGMVMFLGIVLPVYWTAGCTDDGYEDLAAQEHCLNLTNYDRTTLASIVDVSTQQPLKAELLSLRLYAVVICSWILTWYSCYELKQEWIDIQAMRRVYFLEADHWNMRKEEIKNLLLLDESSRRGTSKKGMRDSDNTMFGDEEQALARSGQWKHTGKNKKEEPDYLVSREPWIPHPEQRDTPPAVSLYSVLIGGLPSRPREAAGLDVANAVEDSRRQNVDWQLGVTSAFFDHCVPNQPGFSSSVAAVTILPAAPELATSWTKWYTAASKLRRLRFIRRQIRARRYYDIDDVDSTAGEASPSVKTQEPAAMVGDGHTSIYNDMATMRANYNREVLGEATDEEVEHLFLEAMKFGPEQTAVYSREFAMSAAPCCPNGCFEEVIMDARIDELLEMEQIAMEEVHAANVALDEARSKAVINANSKEIDETSPLKKNFSLELGDQEKKSHKKGISFGAGSSQLDLGPVKNLLGKDSSVMKTGGNSRSKTNGDMDVAIELDFESKLWQKGKHGRSESNLATGTALGRPSVASRCKSDSAAKFLAQPAPPSRTNDEGDVHTSRVIRHCRSSSDPQNDSGLPLYNFPDMSEKTLLDDVPSISELEGQSILDTSNRQYNTPDKAIGPAQINQAFVNREADIGSMWSNHSAPSGVAAQQGVVDAKLDDSNPQGYVSNRPHLFSEPTIGSPNPLLPTVSSPSYGSSSPTFGPSTFGASPRPSFRKRKVSQTWELVEALAHDSCEPGYGGSNDEDHEHTVATGKWEMASINNFVRKNFNKMRRVLTWRTNQAVDVLARDSTYAVVTFTSRQAAVTARRCLADGRGTDRWKQIDALPIPPLADAAACDLHTCRGCCRPVTLSINDNQKKWRKLFGLAFLANFYVFYSIPLTFVAGYANSEKLAEVFPGIEALTDEENGIISARQLKSLTGALIWAGFFAVCPVFFKMVSNFASNATSVLEAEFYALKYFWWFMVVSAFSGSSLQLMVLEGWGSGQKIGSTLESVLRTIAATIPTQVSANWINWILVKFLITMPYQYMLQMNSFLLTWVRLPCCARAVRGGGPGGCTPYRIYVDSGVVLLCLNALAPASPLVAPCAFFYFLTLTPLLRRNVIFMYRPKFDAGGTRWPFLFDMVISSMLVGHILLCTMMVLKAAIAPAVLAALPFVPTVMFRDAMRERYLQAFNDVALLQTSLLDGWDPQGECSMEKREEFRRFLVDAHKAAYVPVCIAGTHSDGVITAEPAVVVPTLNDTPVISPMPSVPEEDPEIHEMPRRTPLRERFNSTDSATTVRRATKSQVGATLRRASIRSPRGSAAVPFGDQFDGLAVNEDGSIVFNLPPIPGASSLNSDNKRK